MPNPNTDDYAKFLEGLLLAHLPLRTKLWILLISMWVVIFGFYTHASIAGFDSGSNAASSAKTIEHPNRDYGLKPWRN